MSTQQPYRPARRRTGSRQLPWPSIVALALFWAASLTSYQWPWGVLFLLMTLPSFFSGQTYLVQVITRKDQPIMFYLVVGSLTLMSIMMIAWDVITYL